MLRPNNFGFNPETKITNSFQNEINENENIVKDKAIFEFDEMVKTIKSHNISVNIFTDKMEKLPDSVFMNNWISVFPDGKLAFESFEQLFWASITENYECLTGGAVNVGTHVCQRQLRILRWRAEECLFISKRSSFARWHQHPP